MAIYGLVSMSDDITKYDYHPQVLAAVPFSWKRDDVKWFAKKIGATHVMTLDDWNQLRRVIRGEFPTYPIDWL